MSTTDLQKTITVIPVYNETGRILQVLEKFNGNIVNEICIVADCTAEKDLEIIRQKVKNGKTPVHIIENEKRMGIGFAIRRGIEYAVERRYDIVVIMAGNNKDDPNEIPKLLKPILDKGFDYVQGSRFIRGGVHKRNPILRGFFSRVYPFIWTLFTKIRCSDVTNGFRAYKLEIFRDSRINIGQRWLNGYGLEYYIHYKVLTLGYNMKEVPVSKTYPFRNKGGYSKIQPLKDWWDIVGPLICLKLGVRQ
jgi:dolichol-phosphate mannosyltransferase